MAKPTMITVTGTVLGSSGPMAGWLVFASQTLVHDSGSDDVMTPQEIVVVVGDDGEVNVDIPSNNDPAFSPTGWTWEVRPHFPSWRTPFSVSIPWDAPGGVLRLSDLAPVAPDGTGELYALINHTHAGGGGGSGPVAASTVVASTTFAQAQAVGVATTYARGDHVHGTPATPTPAGIGAATAAHTHAGVYDPSGAAATAVTAHEAASDPHPQYAVIYYWNGSAYVAVPAASVYVSGPGPGSPTNGDVWFP